MVIRLRFRPEKGATAQNGAAFARRWHCAAGHLYTPRRPGVSFFGAQFMSQAVPSAAPQFSASGAPEPVRSIFLVSYPKVVFLYPTFVAALIAGAFC